MESLKQSFVKSSIEEREKYIRRKEREILDLKNKIQRAKIRLTELKKMIG